MSTGRTLLPLLLASGLGLLGCRARLPVDPPAPDAAAVAAVAPVGHRPRRGLPSDWAALVRGDDPSEARGSSHYTPLEPDRLRDVVRYNPPSSGQMSVGEYIFMVRICTPGQD